MHQSAYRKISISETSPIGVATKMVHKYKWMHHIRSPLSAIARQLLFQIQVGEFSPSSVDGVDESSHFECILELVRRENPELNIEHNLEEQWIVVSR